MTQPLKISAVAFREGGSWVIQGIEYDIVAHTHDLTTAPHTFLRAVVENIVITEHLGRQPLEGIKPAPERFRAMYDAGITEMRPLGGDDPPGAEVAVRVAA